MIDLVLFDFDGTLADTAPDLAAVANRQRNERGLPDLPLAALRPLASQGARGLIGCALGVVPGDREFEPLRQQFFDYYDAALCVHTRLFPDVDRLLAELEAAGKRWGIVTNKISRFTTPIVRALRLEQRATCVVCGDTLAYTKPHPAQLLHALDLGKTTADRAVYVGDDLRDVQAARAVAMRSVVAAYGYLGADEDIEQWGGDHTISQPLDLLDWIRAVDAA